MPVAILHPTGAGALTEWTAVAAATNWQAVSSDPAASIAANTAGQRDRYTFDDLPAGATGINSLAVYGDCSGDDVARMRFTLDLAGVESNGATFVPPDGGTLNFSTSFALAPGGVAWTVTRVNALTGGPDAVDGAFPDLGVAELWLYVEYTTADDTGREDAYNLPLSRTDADRVSLGRSETARPALSRTASPRIDLGRTEAVDTPLSRTVAVRIDLTEG